MDFVFHVYMQQENKAMVMKLYMTSSETALTTHHDTNNNNIYMIVVRQLTLTTKHKTI
jgi:hypothetical protein